MKNSCSQHSLWAQIEWMVKSDPLPVLALIMGALHQAAILWCRVPGLHGSQELIRSGLAIIMIKPNNASQITLSTLCSLMSWHFRWAALFLSRRRRERKRCNICYEHCCWQGFNMMLTTQSRSWSLCTAGDMTILLRWVFRWQVWLGTFSELEVDFILLLFR